MLWLALATLVVCAAHTNSFTLDTGHKSIELMHGTFVVLGAAGSGKTTLINYITQKEGPCGSHPDTYTDRSTQYDSGLLTIDDIQLKLRFLDTIGFDAHDVKSDELFVQLSEAIIVMGDPRVNAVILVHKMERFRSHFWGDLEKILKMFQLFQIKPEHVLVVITHSALYSDDVKMEYQHQLFEKLKERHNNVLETNIMHVNFIKATEIHPEFLPYFNRTAPIEFEKIVRKLMMFNSPFNPNTYILDRMRLKETIKQDLDGQDESKKTVQERKSEKKQEKKAVVKEQRWPFFGGTKREEEEL